MGELTPIHGKFTAVRYAEILDEVLLLSLRAYGLLDDGVVYFVQDRCPIHMSRIIREWFTDHPEIEPLNWPAKGCDMNPIENICGNMVNTWEQCQDWTHAALLQHAMQEWEVMKRRPQIVYKHVESMAKWLQQVIQVMGGWTKYWS